MKLIGVYSYPKSGNTWVRVILGNVMGKNALQIPDLHKQRLEDAKPFNGLRFFKHHAGRNLKMWQGQKLETDHVIHIRRNPLDVFMSYLNFISDNVTGTAPIRFPSVEAIHGTDLFDLYFHTFIVTGQFSVVFGHTTRSYFDHNQFWLTQTEVPVTHLRYEDMLDDPLTAMAPVAKLIGVDDETMSNALAKAAEKTKPNGKFFWKQQAKNYVNYLSDAQIEQFLKYRGEDSAALGYDAEYLLERPKS